MGSQLHVFPPFPSSKGRAGGSVGARPCKAGEGPTAGRYRTHHLWRPSATFLGQKKTIDSRNLKDRHQFQNSKILKMEKMILAILASAIHHPSSMEYSFNCGLPTQNWASKVGLGAPEPFQPTPSATKSPCVAGSKRCQDEEPGLLRSWALLWQEIRENQTFVTFFGGKEEWRGEMDDVDVDFLKI